jgi:hypothetical protein
MLQELFDIAQRHLNQMLTPMNSDNLIAVIN